MIAVRDRSSAGAVGPDVVALDAVAVGVRAPDIDAHVAVARDDVPKALGIPDQVLRRGVDRHSRLPVGQGDGPCCVRPDVIANNPVSGQARSIEKNALAFVAGDDVPRQSADHVGRARALDIDPVPHVPEIQSAGGVRADPVSVDLVLRALHEPDAVAAVGRDQVVLHVNVRAAELVDAVARVADHGPRHEGADIVVADVAIGRTRVKIHAIQAVAADPVPPHRRPADPELTAVVHPDA